MVLVDKEIEELKKLYTHKVVNVLGSAGKA